MEQTESLADLYVKYRALLFALAYRMMGSVADAEDAVQEAFLDYEAARSRRHDIRHVKAYLCKIVTHRCMDRLRSASRQREVYVGPWLPEPLLTESAAGLSPGLGGASLAGAVGPAERYLQKESLSTAYLLLLQQLSDVERAVFILREVLQYDYEEIAEIVGKTAANCRQIFHRAKRAVSASASGDAPASGQGQDRLAAARVQADAANRLTERFVQALSSGNMEALLGLLSEHAVLSSDGGGQVSAAIRPVTGRSRVIAFLQGVLKKQPAEELSIRLAEVNGGTGIITKLGGQTNAVFTFAVEDAVIAHVYIVVNPDKLRHVE
ncbi:RNA polymerase sigma factor SigJ [Paenibacillus koleovorans]|uniref:RNA polymerase sigma factor SigJ n=1 Tax=Paenibacillus koleovorans TaxID=121608 RepID=UPI000FD8BA27|nr:RNA polymerase sigma factor SigJ [Paenibacillus koleovorans]